MANKIIFFDLSSAPFCIPREPVPAVPDANTRKSFKNRIHNRLQNIIRNNVNNYVNNIKFASINVKKF